MANVNTIKSRIVHKHDTLVNWEKAENFIPLEGEIIIYDVDENTNRPRLKIGDGVTKVFNLPFYEEEPISDEEIARICGMTIENGEVAKL